MRSSSVFRAKDRGSKSDKASASVHSKEVAPVAGKSFPGVSVSKKSIVPPSRPLASLKKPSIEVIPRIEKPLSVVRTQEERLRSASAPRGRNSSFSNVNLMLSDLRKQKNFTVLKDYTENRNANIEPSRGKLTKEARILSKAHDRKLKDSIERGNVILNDSLVSKGESKASEVECVGRRGKVEAGDAWIIVGCKIEDNLRSVQGEKGDDADCDAFSQVRRDDKFFSGEGVLKGIEPRTSVPRPDESSVELNVSASGESVRIQARDIYSRKLHEKLAFLESKVKRIASDIKSTKEMLDCNNLNAPRMLLSDIQERVMEIEKAVDHVTNSDISLSYDKEKMTEKYQKNQKEDGDSLFKGLNNKELEARFLPHLKLLKSRSTLKPSLPSSESQVERKDLNPIDENSVTLEFLDSLRKEYYNDSSRDRDVEAGPSDAQGIDSAAWPVVHDAAHMHDRRAYTEVVLTADETIDEVECQECQPMITDDNSEALLARQLNEIGNKTSTGGWFVSEGEAVLLAHDDSSCSFYDISNCEEKAKYKPPAGTSSDAWRDCWIVRASGVDGSCGKYVIAASAGNTTSGFCSWDFYTRDVRAFMSTSIENKQWWYTPCGPLIASTASIYNLVNFYDIRDGEEIMHLKVQNPVLEMDYSSPLQWRNRGEVVVAEAEGITLYDVRSLTSKALLSIPFSGQKALALHICNTDAEVGGGVRQRIGSSEAEGNDGVFCTSEFINILDFRNRTGIGLKIPNPGITVQSIFSRGDSVLLGGTTTIPSESSRRCSSLVQQFSLRKQKLANTYMLPDSDAHIHYKGITQVWGNSTLVMAICGLGLFVFDASKDDISGCHKARETVGPDDLYSPSFDYSCSRMLLISKDRPALWRHL